MIKKALSMWKDEDIRNYILYALKHPYLACNMYPHKRIQPELLNQCHQDLQSQVSSPLITMDLVQFLNKRVRLEEKEKSMNTSLGIPIFISLASCELKISRKLDIDFWEKSFADDEDMAALHRFIYMYQILIDECSLEDKTRYFSALEAMILSWCKAYSERNKKELHSEIFQSYTVAERLTNWTLCLALTAPEGYYNKQIFSSIQEQAEFLLSNLEYYGDYFTGNHFFNNGKALYIVGQLLGAKKYSLAGKKIMITGSAGSIGSEMVRQIAVYNPTELILIDQAETPQHNIRLMMHFEWPNIKAHTIVANISNEERMDKIFHTYRPDYVFHAAAYKHVPMMENNPSESIQNNILGTKVIADLSVKYGVKKFVMISTDKAVNPTNVMGCSKRICEIYCQSLNKMINEHAGDKPVTQFVTTRFGNVLGSNGSVIPLFEKQIKNGGPVTVTDPNIIRFFMLIPEACKLVLEAGTHGSGGEIFVFDMGKPVKIADLAKRMIKLSGAKDIEIKYTGLRAGEKLYEEVLSTTENTLPSFHEKIRIAKVREYDYSEVSKQIDSLIALSHTYDDMAIVEKMKEIVPEYVSNNSKYSVLDKK